MFEFKEDEYSAELAKAALASCKKALPEQVIKDIASRKDLEIQFTEQKLSFRSDTDNLSTFRLVKYDAGDDGNAFEEEEMVFACKGLLSSKELPPISKPVYGPDHAKHLSQSVTITGLNDAGFSNMIDSLYTIQEHFQNLVGDSECQQWTPEAFDDEFLCITATNRYFKVGRIPAHIKVVDFPTTVDPWRKLQQINGGKLKHTTDNVVQYWETKKVVDAKGSNTTTVKEIPPARIAPGQIVEIQMSLMFIKGRNKGKYGLFLILRSINILDETALKSAREKKFHRQNNFNSDSRSKDKKSLKRKVGYMFADVELTTSKLQKIV